MIPNLTSDLSAKANQSTTYTKLETNGLLDAKANASNVYSKNETNDLLDAKQDNINIVNGIQSYLYPQNPLKFTNGTIQISGLPF